MSEDGPFAPPPSWEPGRGAPPDPGTSGPETARPMPAAGGEPPPGPFVAPAVGAAPDPALLAAGRRFPPLSRRRRIVVACGAVVALLMLVVGIAAGSSGRRHVRSVEQQASPALGNFPPPSIPPVTLPAAGAPLGQAAWCAAYQQELHLQDQAMVQGADLNPAVPSDLVRIRHEAISEAVALGKLGEQAPDPTIGAAIVTFAKQEIGNDEQVYVPQPSNAANAELATLEAQAPLAEQAWGQALHCS